MSKKITRPPHGVDHSETLAELTKKSLMASDNVTFIETLQKFPHLNPHPFLENLAHRTIALTKLIQDRKRDSILRVWVCLHEEGFTFLYMPDVLLLIARLRRHGHIPKPKRRGAYRVAGRTGDGVDITS